MNTIVLLKRILTVTTAAILLAACQADGTKPAITFEGGEVPSPSFPAAKSTITLKFTSTLNWTAKSSASWLTLDKESGDAGESTLALTAESNSEDVDRSAYVTLVSSSAGVTLNKTIKVTQSFKEILTTKLTKIPVKYEGDELVIEITANVSYTVETDADWLNYVSETKAEETNEATFTVDPSWSKNRRTGTAKFTSVSGLTTLNVKFEQEANPNPGEGEETPFTTKCSKVGAYSKTGTTPECTMDFSDYQYSFGNDATGPYFNRIDFDKGIIYRLSVESLILTVGSKYNVTTFESNDGAMESKKSESMTLVMKRSGKAWLEDKNSKTGYIIEVE